MTNRYNPDVDILEERIEKLESENERLREERLAFATTVAELEAKLERYINLVTLDTEVIEELGVSDE